MTVRVAINGYGTIGKRVADAVALQDDMEVAGVTKNRPSFEARRAVERGFPLYGATPKGTEALRAAGLPVKGGLDDLLGGCDIVVDCAPGDIGAQNLATYRKRGVKAVFQGGEEHEAIGWSFNSSANFAETAGKPYVRVVSCNTTGLIRTLLPLQRAGAVESIYAVMVRRATDPNDSKKGPINSIEPSLKIPSHHGPDVASVLTGLPIHTMAVKVPTTIMHLHAVVVRLSSALSTEDVASMWRAQPRVVLVKASEGLPSTAQLMEWARDQGRSRGDLWETVLWAEGMKVDGRTLYYYQAIHQESDVVPENVDCIRAMTGAAADGAASIEKTDRSMGILRPAAAVAPPARS
ncbi:MAG TPA: type II glyceraldehyde-3-phosphate dehydrogenase [Candidatus Thermoplasmatota archaeon]